MLLFGSLQCSFLHMQVEISTQIWVQFCTAAAAVITA